MKPPSRLLRAVLVGLCAMPAGAVAQGIPAQRVVRETANDWKNARQLTLAPQAKWCASPDDEGCDFKSIDDAILLPDGGVVASSVPGPMRHFGANGKIIGTLSSKGKGPGEYGFIAQPRLVRDRIVWFDNTQMRITSVDLKNTPGKVIAAMMPMTTGMIYMVAETLVVLDVPASTDTNAIVEAVYRTVPSTGAPRVLARVKTRALFQPGSNFFRAGAPFRTLFVSDVGADGSVAHSNGDRYAVDVFPAKGTPWRLESTAPVRAVTQADRDSVIAQTLKVFRAKDVASLPPQMRAQFDVKISTFPPLGEIRALRDGTTWIRPVSMAGETTWRWDVFTADGKRLGQARLPIGAHVRDGMKDWVLVVELGDDDVPRLVKYTVR